MCMVLIEEEISEEVGKNYRHFPSDLCFLFNFAANFFPFLIFFFFCFLLLKMHILTSVWGAQHPNAGRNMQ